MIRTLFCLFALLLFGTTHTANAEIKTSGLPIPRFVSLHSNQVNLRAGPGLRYPVEWVYLKQNLPFEVIGEFDNWRMVRDWEGTEGWIHKMMLSGKRSVRVTGVERLLRSDNFETARPVARIESGVVGKLVTCPKNSEFCKVEINKMSGWLKRGEFWGVYPDEYIE